MSISIRRIFSLQRVWLTALIGSLSLAALYAATAQAQTWAGELPQTVVHYSDLNLSTESGIQALYKRLQVASRQVCRAYEGRNLWSSYAKWQACYDQALAGAVNKVNLQQLTVLYRTRTRASLT